MLHIDTNIYICIVYRYTHTDIYTYRYRVCRYTQISFSDIRSWFQYMGSLSSVMQDPVP